MADHVFETTSSQLLHSGKIFALRRDEVLMPGGATATRDVVEHFGAVAVVALDADGRIPLIYQYRHALGHAAVGTAHAACSTSVASRRT